MEKPSTRPDLADGSSSLPYQSAEESTTPRTSRRFLKAAAPSQTPDPSTPDLCWDNTPTVSSILATPEDDSDSDGGALTPVSPLVAREQRARLKRFAAIRFDLSSPPKVGNFVKPNALPCVDHTALIEGVVNIENQKPIHLDPLKDEHKLDEYHHGSLSATQYRILWEGDASSQRRTPDGHQDAVKLEGRGLVLQSEVGDDSHEVIPTPNRCGTPITSNTPEINHNVDSQSDLAVSALADWLAALTTKADTESVEALDISEATDGFVNLTVSWRPSATLLQLLPTNVIGRLRDSPIRCVANTVRGSKSGRCTHNNAARLTKEHVDKLLEDICALPPPLEIPDIMRIVQDLGARAFCEITHMELALKEFAELSSYADRTDVEGGSATTTGSETDTANTHSALEVWAEGFLQQSVCILSMDDSENGGRNEVARVLLKVEHDRPPTEDTSTTPKRAKREKEETEELPHPENGVEAAIFQHEVNWDRLQRKAKPRRRPETLFGSREFSPDTRSTHLYHDFQPYCTKKDMKKSAPQLIREVLKAPLTKTDVEGKGSSIYIYWHPGNFGYVKIGRGVDPESRLKNWRHQCKMEVEQITNSGEERQFQVLYPVRIEKLIHTELKEYRLKEPECPGCGKSHVEWFSVNPGLALKVVQKWVELPLYEGGRLKESLTEAEIDKVCEVTTLEQVVHPKPSANARPKTPLAIRARRSRRSSSRVQLADDPTAGPEDDIYDISKWRFPPLTDYPIAASVPLCDDKVSVPVPTVAKLVDPIVS